jgi:YD repeat-containing protein
MEHFNQILTLLPFLHIGFYTANPVFPTERTRTTHTRHDDAYLHLDGQTYQAVITTQNEVDGDPQTGAADEDVQAITLMDNAGNLVWQRDPLGRWTHTIYDALNRPAWTIVNYDFSTPPPDDATFLAVASLSPGWEATPTWAASPDRNLVTATLYNPDGSRYATVENWIDGAFDSLRPDEDRITIYAYDALGRLERTIRTWEDGDPATGGTDTDQMTSTAYDPVTGQVIGSQDALGRWTSQQYDVLGRVFQTTQNCTDGNGNPVPPHTCAAFDAAHPDRNITSQTNYDALGRASEAVDALGHVTHTDYDALGRTQATTWNYVDGSFDPATPDEDVRSGSRQYDALGRVAERSDAEGSITRYAYNGLGQLTEQRQFLSAGERVTRMGYDGTGTRRWTHAPDGTFTVTEVDGLGRVTATIVNYQDGTIDASDGSDRDLTTRAVV